MAVLNPKTNYCFKHNTHFMQEENGNFFCPDCVIEESEKEIEELNLAIKAVKITFRWNQNELDRCKNIAEAKGLPYQSYIKSSLKMIMDKDEKELSL